LFLSWFIPNPIAINFVDLSIILDIRNALILNARAFGELLIVLLATDAVRVAGDKKICPLNLLSERGDQKRL
jgi:hypothetical protein